jgi:hypothetical protein
MENKCDFTKSFEKSIMKLQEKETFIDYQILEETFNEIKKESIKPEDKEKNCETWINQWLQTLQRLNPTMLWRSNSLEF